MAKDNFAAVMDEVFAHEGGLSTTPKDPGNWTSGRVGEGDLRGTKYGIAAHAHPTVNIRDLTKAQAAEIYRRAYWQAIRGDELRRGLDLVTMDAAVNSGVSRGVRWLQMAAGVRQDGKMGPLTLSAANDSADPIGVIQRACAARLGFLRGLRIWGSFGRGWSRRVASVEAVATRMVVQRAGAPARPVLIDARDKATATARRDEATAGAGGISGAGGFTFADVPDWTLWVLGILLVIFVVNQVGRARLQKDRAAAFQTAAEGADK
ncbi:MAG: glycoside hydrolase family 108 protein [Paracoccaceae bacterium]